jgi:hypothetical protein
MARYANCPTRHERLNLSEGLAQPILAFRNPYSAASLAPPLFRGLPPAFFSTGARNFPV